MEAGSRGMLAWLVALLAARWLVPTEASAQGMTLWLTTLVLFTALLSAALAWRFDAGRPKFDAIDGSIWLLIAAQAISALGVVFTVGNQRAAINLAWEWIGSGVLIWLLRRQLTSTRVVRELCVGLSLTAAVLAGHGLWQHYVWFPQMVGEYERLVNEVDSLTKSATGDANVRLSPDDSRRLSRRRAEMVRQGIPSEEPARRLWEQRLKSSREPFGLFALANSFAGLVMVAVIIQWGSLVTEWPVRHQRWPLLVCFFAGFGVTAYCLMLTKSRSAWAGLFAGLVWWGLRALMSKFAARRRENLELSTQNSVLSTRTSPDADLKQSPATRHSSRVTWVMVGIVVVGAAVTIAAVSGGLDREVLSEAPKSLRYRIEYWRATWETIRENFWLGTGPGNFRDHYLKHKLPESSEEIADPHNLVLDVWANAGVLGLIGLLACVALMARTWLRPCRNDVPSDQGRMPSHVFGWSWTSSAVWGAGLAFPLVAIGLDLFGHGTDERLWWLGTVWWLLWIGLEPISRFSALMRSPGQRIEPPMTSVPRSGFGLVSMLEAANVALLVHLLGAGGIAMPAMTQLLCLVWVMRAAMSDQKGAASNESSSSTLTRGGVNAPRVWLGLLGGAALLSGICLMSALLPDLFCRTSLAVGDAILTEGRDVAAARHKYEAAVAADRFAIEPRERLAELTFELSRQSRRVADRDEAVRRQRAVIDRMPFASRPWRRLGQMWMTWFRQTRDPDHARLAAEAFAAAVERYPHHAGLLAEWASAAAEARLTEQARVAARRALRQDDLNHQAGHVDKFLGKNDRLLIERLANEHPARQRPSDAN